MQTNEQTENEFDDEIEMEEMNSYNRSSLIARQISFTQRRATFGEILLICLPYFILLVDIFLFFLLRGFQLNPSDESVVPD